MEPVSPRLSRNDVLAFQFSSWYPRFEHASIKSSIIRPLGEDFRRYMLADGVRIPDGADGTDEEADQDVDDSDDEEPQERFAFPEVDAKIRQAIEDYGADASWILPPSSPLRCSAPSEVYMLLKSSDFVLHDVEEESVFEGCTSDAEREVPRYELELVLRKWYHVDPSREFRCFVRSKKLLGISQRDQNFYPYMTEQETRKKIVDTIEKFWIREIQRIWPTEDYTFDLILTRDLESGHIVDFNPYAPRTDPLLFTYDELFMLRTDSHPTPVLKTIDSGSHEAATRSSPANVHNMVPFELLSMSSGQTLDDFTRDWQREIERSMKEDI
ncbi:hypothetical protein A7U60_g5065 [Sanghuangporus baumii]|uniref:Cell division cycle protein 123 n=1 Tax=Sanghuangporus baumii TaxID=108892 RepID=A0A9Q5HXB7_SANBA|nr:hypothetical protein A7U60_g5065 [Sanghuangporus baumii]